jgi:hypothetical protein
VLAANQNFPDDAPVAIKLRPLDDRTLAERQGR